MSKMSAAKAAIKTKANKAKMLSERESSRRKKEEIEQAIKTLTERVNELYARDARMDKEKLDQTLASLQGRVLELGEMIKPKLKQIVSAQFYEAKEWIE